MMKFLRFIFPLIFLFSFFAFCGKKNDDEKNAIPPNSGIVSSDEMVQILEDVYLAEGAINSKEQSSDNPQYFANRYYNYILKKHNMTGEQFMESYTYYSSNAEEMVKILELIINDLSRKQGLLQSDKK
ncbi:MAG: DUF4296 domain-containing protein [Bacteroidota bacterium]